MSARAGGAAPEPSECRRRVLIVCAHEPEFDPRIDWAAKYAPSQVDRVVLGFFHPSRPKPAIETTDGAYSIRRIERNAVSGLRGGILLMRELIANAPVSVRVRGILALSLIGVPLVVLHEVGIVVLAVWSVLVGLLRILLGSATPVIRRSLVVRACRYLCRSVWNRVRLRWEPLATRIRVFRSVLHYYVKTNAAIVAAVGDSLTFDVVHANDLDTLPAAVVVKWKTGARVIYDSHEYWPYSDVEAHAFESRFWRRLEGFLVRFADAAFTVSDSLADELTRSYGRQFSALPNCEPNPLVQPTVLSEVQPSQGPVRFLYQGNFAPQRGLEELLSAWTMLSESRAQLCLRGPASPSRDACKRLTEELELRAPRVQFLDPVHEGELVSAAVEFDVGVIPYKPDALAYRFACPNKLSQYMQAGLAILSNNLPYVAGLLERYSCGVVYDSKDAVSVARAVDRLASDPVGLAQMKTRAKAAALTDFNWQSRSGPLYTAYLTL
jgi:glycosyltransferase involved in cell wall biosynthesis